MKRVPDIRIQVLNQAPVNASRRFVLYWMTSYSGIFWLLGRDDRPWGPERPIFGKVRYMASRNTARKIHLKGYLKKYGAPDPHD